MNGIDGFLPWRASIMLDVVFLAMFLVIPVMGWSIYQVKYRQKYDLHKKVQLSLGLVLLITVGLFEVDMQIFTDWGERADPSGVHHAAHHVARVAESHQSEVSVLKRVRELLGGHPAVLVGGQRGPAQVTAFAQVGEWPHQGAVFEIRGQERVAPVEEPVEEQVE